MSVQLYFGLPGCGKTTLMASFAYKAVLGKKYDHVYCNVHMSIPGVTYIDNDCIGKFDMHDGLILIDEATLFADSRAYKSFDSGKLMYFLEHRHFNVDIILFTQQWDGVDRKIRVITDRVFYVYKGFLFGKWFTSYYRIPYGIIIPDPNKNQGSSQLGEIIQGYCKPPFLVRLFSPKIFRPMWYKYFDSWERPALDPLPSSYSPHIEIVDGVVIDKPQKLTLKRILNKTGILLRSFYCKTKEGCSAVCYKIKVFFRRIFRRR